MGRGDPTHGQWAGLEPLLPQGIKPGRPPVWTRRQLTDGIRWRPRTGAPWRDVPERHGPWDRVHDRFRRWQRDGTWPRIVTHQSVTGPWPRDTTSLPSVTRRPCRWQSATSGCDQPPA
ncbi:transposase [Streptomyces sp. NPDC048187]|uniref:transposase n=1 Tax=Streptomyces sp. NPDC048187 TaxID=3365509 RepID=UPI00371C7F92